MFTNKLNSGINFNFQIKTKRISIILNDLFYVDASYSVLPELQVKIPFYIIPVR